MPPRVHFGPRGRIAIGVYEDEMIGLDPLGGLENEAGNNDDNEDAGAVGGCLDNKALEFVITFVLPLGNDLDAVAELE